MAAAGESSETAGGVCGQTSVEKYLAGRRMPERHHPWARRFLRLQGDEAERVIRKVHRDVEPDDDAAGGAESCESGDRDQGKWNVERLS